MLDHSVLNMVLHCIRSSADNAEVAASGIFALAMMVKACMDNDADQRQKMLSIDIGIDLVRPSLYRP